MHTRTLFRYLIGDRTAIETIASCPRARWVGGMFVLSAGFARDYDGKDLVSEPWHVLIPFAASLVSSFALFFVLFLKSLIRQADRPSFWRAYGAFLGLFWMTAPLAWLYAIPYERFLSAPNAMRANLLTLGFVAVWRVLLMIRVAQVMFGFRTYQAVFLVFAFGDGVLLTAISYVPVPILQFMGGVQLTESERILVAVTEASFLLGFLTAPVWGLGALLVIALSRPTWTLPITDGSRDRSPGWDIKCLAAAALGVWMFVLPITQSEQHLRHRVDNEMRNGQVREALAIMSAHQRRDFPPRWDPPPRGGRGESPNLSVLGVLDIIAAERSAPWVRQIYLEKLFHPDEYGWRLNLGRTAEALIRLPEGPEMAKPHRDSFADALKAESMTPQAKQAIQTLLERMDSGAGD